MDGYNFTNRARLALHTAGDASAEFHHEYIGTEHLLLGLLRDRESAATLLLARLGTDFDAIRAQIKATVKPGVSPMPADQQRPYTSRVKKVLELAMVAAREDSHSAVGTQHLLVGLLREKIGIGAQVLEHFGVTLPMVTAALEGAPPIED